MTDLNRILDTTRDLIRFRTTADRPDEIGRCLDYVGDFFRRAGWKVRGFERRGVKSVFVGENLTPKVLFAAHLDVVPGADGQFEPREQDGRLYARGALDMKSGTAALMQLAQDMGPSADLGLILTTDEESGGFDGTKFLLEQGIRPQAVILPDGGKDWQNIVQKEKGVLWVKLTAQGKPAHGSTPWQGENAIQKLNRALDAVQTGFMPHDQHPENHWVATCNVGRVEGGGAANKVADSASAVCDIRLTEEDDPQAIFAGMAANLPDGVVIEKLLDEPLVFVPQGDPAVAAYAAAIREAGGNPNFTLDHGSSDARFFTPLGVPVILSQPTGDGHHGTEEWVDIASIGKYADTVRGFLRIYAGR